MHVWTVYKTMSLFNRTVGSRTTLECFKCIRLNLSTLTEHQKKLMGRGLPKQKEIPGVKTIICVASGKGVIDIETLYFILDKLKYQKLKIKKVEWGNLRSLSTWPSHLRIISILKQVFWTRMY